MQTKNNLTRIVSSRFRSYGKWNLATSARIEFPFERQASQNPWIWVQLTKTTISRESNNICFKLRDKNEKIVNLMPNRGQTKRNCTKYQFKKLYSVWNIVSLPIAIDERINLVTRCRKKNTTFLRPTGLMNVVWNKCYVPCKIFRLFWLSSSFVTTTFLLGRNWFFRFCKLLRQAFATRVWSGDSPRVLNPITQSNSNNKRMKEYSIKRL